MSVNTHIMTTNNLGNLSDVNETGIGENKILKRNGSGVLIPQTIINEIFYHVNQTVSWDSNETSLISIGIGLDDNLSFAIPSDLSSIVSLHLICGMGGSYSNQDIDLSASYAGDGENYQTHTASDTSSTYNFNANYFEKIDISSLFSSLSSNDICGLKVINGSGNSGDLYVLGIILKYNKTQGY